MTSEFREPSSLARSKTVPSSVSFLTQASKTAFSPQNTGPIRQAIAEILDREVDADFNYRKTITSALDRLRQQDEPTLHRLENLLAKSMHALEGIPDPENKDQDGISSSAAFFLLHILPSNGGLRGQILRRLSSIQSSNRASNAKNHQIDNFPMRCVYTTSTKILFLVLHSQAQQSTSTRVCVPHVSSIKNFSGWYYPSTGIIFWQKKEANSFPKTGQLFLKLERARYQ